MAFIRLKKRKIGGREVFYAYLVKNTWSRKLKSPRQKVSRYLGRVHDAGPASDIGFAEYMKITDIPDYVAKSARSKIIDDLVRWELSRHSAEVEFSGRKLIREGKEAILRINEGYMCRLTLARLYRFKTRHDDPHYIGIDLATAFTDAGIAIPSEVFTAAFDKFAAVEY